MERTNRLRIFTETGPLQPVFLIQMTAADQFHLAARLGADFDFETTLFITFDTPPRISAELAKAVNQLGIEDSPIIRTIKQINSDAGKQVHVSAIEHEGRLVVLMKVSELKPVPDKPESLVSSLSKYVKEKGFFRFVVESSRADEVAAAASTGQWRDFADCLSITLEGSTEVSKKFLSNMFFNKEDVLTAGLLLANLELQYEAIPGVFLDEMQKLLQKEYFKRKDDPVLEELGSECRRVRVQHFQPGLGVFQLQTYLSLILR